MSAVLDKMRLLAAVGVASLALAACGGGGGDSPAQTDPDQDTQSGGSEGTDTDNTDSETPGGGSNGGGDSDNNPGSGNASVCMGDDVAACKEMEMQLLAATTKAELEAADTALHEDTDDGYPSLPQDQREALFSLVDDRLAALAPLEVEANRIKDAIVYVIDTPGGLDLHPVDMDTADYYGVWLAGEDTPGDPGDDLTVRFEPPSGKMSGPDLGDTDMGTATYAGDVEGYAYHQDMADGYKAGRFTADITLNADFGAQTLTGTVSDFSGAGASPGWEAATLEAVGLVGRTATTDGTAGGRWTAQAYYPDNDGSGRFRNKPDGYVGHMTLRYSDGAAFGAFDAKR